MIDRTDWEAGPWDTEPDRVEFRTASGLPGLIVRNEMGSLCGYAAVPPGHPLHGKDYDAADVSVHGGLTYCGECSGKICHVPEPGEPDDVWWFGFDTGHWQDKSPGLDATMKKMRVDYGLAVRDRGGIYKDVAYVKEQVEQLAQQLKELDK